MKELRLWKPSWGVECLVLHQGGVNVGEFGFMVEHSLKPIGAGVGHLHIGTPDGGENMRVYVNFMGEEEEAPMGYCYNVEFDVQPLDEVCGLPDWEIRRDDGLRGYIDIVVPDDAEWKWVEYETEGQS